MYPSPRLHVVRTVGQHPNGVIRKKGDAALLTGFALRCEAPAAHCHTHAHRAYLHARRVLDNVAISLGEERRNVAYWRKTNHMTDD